MTTVIILSNGDWVPVPEGADPDAFRQSQEAQLTYFREGIFFNEETNEYEVWMNGEPVAWSECPEQAKRSQQELMDYSDVIIPFMGEYPSLVEPLTNDESFDRELPV